MVKKVVIIGGVAGGASCAARLRRLDETAEIVMLERGGYVSYANCGLPYHVSDVISERDALLLQTPKSLKERFNIDVRTMNEALSIDREKKTVEIKNHITGETYSESYDYLVIATGSSPLRPPIQGIDSPLIRTLWTVPDTDEIRRIVKSGIGTAAVIGGGFIGLEMAENLREAGLEVTLIEALDQVMAPLDFEMASILHENIRDNGVNLRLGDGVASFTDEGDRVKINLKSGDIVSAELVILSIGVRPNSGLAKAAGLSINERGGIIVDDMMRTSDSAIYAVGDVIEVKDIVSGEPTMIPLAGPANKQGRIAADNIAGFEERYAGTQGSAVAKVFDLTAASTGQNEKTLKKRGLKKGTDYETVTISQNSHAGYYPGAAPMMLKLIFTADGEKILGAQIVGMDGVDKRIDTIGVALRLGAGVKDLKNLELAYAPPYSSAKDPVNMAGFTAENVIKGLLKMAEWNEPDTNEEAIRIDVREEAEVAAYAIPGAKNIPLGSLRERVGELDKSREYIIFCAIGVRAYNALRILRQNGIEKVKLYPGGARFYRSLHSGSEEPKPSPEIPISGGNSGMDSGSGSESNSDGAMTGAGSENAAGIEAEGAGMRQQEREIRKICVNCSGLQCPGPIMEVFKNIKDMQEGDILEVTSTDIGFAKDIASWCRRTGNELVSNGRKGNAFIACIRKGKLTEAEVCPIEDTGSKNNGKTIIVFDGDMDKVLASFVIANGALAMGRPVTMFFTFWGLTALRKESKVSLKKNAVEKMFGAMLPRGSRKLKLSKMNMGGMGTMMMRKIMNDKNIDSLEDMMKNAMEAGVKIIACSMSMDVMGIRKEELIDGVEIGGVGTYLGDAEESNVNLFI